MWGIHHAHVYLREMSYMPNVKWPCKSQVLKFNYQYLKMQIKVSVDENKAID